LVPAARRRAAAARSA